ncbi:MAG: CotH kinase family protein [Chitinophagaceae bacterium]|nr:CotH kinase family protein [Chitinophagaceae bacterium]
MTPLFPKAIIFLCPAFILAVSSCKKEYITEQIITQAPPETTKYRFERFGFKASDNIEFLNDSIDLDITGNTITGRIPYYTSITSLAPFFETNGATAAVNSAVQQSGVSKQDFSREVIYKLSGDNGIAQEYTVKLFNFTGLPVIRINTENNQPVTSKENYVNAKIVVDGAGLYDNINSDITIKGRGNTTWSLPKKPYKFKFAGKESLFGLPKDKEWLLLANYTDKTQLRNKLAFQLGQLSDLDWTPHSIFVELFLNEEYVGTYQVCESIKTADQRVNVTDDGYVLEVDQESRLDPGDVFFKTARMLVNIKEPDLEKDDAKYNFIKEYLTEAENTLFGNDFTDPENGYAKYLDVNSFVDWYLINEIARNNDAVFYSSCYMNLAPGGKLKMGPLWDFDIAFGNINYNGNSTPEGLWVNRSQWMKRLFLDPAFKEKVTERFGYFKSKKNEILDFINRQSSTLKWSVIENNNKWGTLYNYTWPNYEIWGSYDNEVIYLKNWISQRIDWLDKAFNEQ